MINFSEIVEIRKKYAFSKKHFVDLIRNYIQNKRIIFDLDSLESIESGKLIEDRYFNEIREAIESCLKEKITEDGKLIWGPRNFALYRNYEDSWSAWLEKTLKCYSNENPLIDFKQGFFQLDPKNPKFSDKSLDTILKTCVAISNHKRGTVGHVIIGIPDEIKDAEIISRLFSFDYIFIGNWIITGIDHELLAMNKTEDEFERFISDKIKNSKVSDPLNKYIRKNIRGLRYRDRLIYILTVEGQESPSSFSGNYYDRKGAQNDRILDEDLDQFERRYNISS